MLPSRALAAAFVVGVVVALAASSAHAHASADPAPDPAAFGPLKDLASTVNKEANKVVNAVKGAVRRMRLKCSCNKSNLSCRCCTPIDVPEVKFKKEVCLNTRFRLSNFAAIISILVDKKSVAQHTVSVANPPPICVPVPKFPMLRLCVRAHNLGIVNNKMRICLNLEVKLMGNTIVTVEFECIHADLKKKKG